MLTRVDVLSENSFYLELRDARPTDSITVEKIEGLDPPDIDLFMGDYARDGGYYSGRRVPPRDVTFLLGYNPNYGNGESVSGLRKMLYKAFLNPFPQSKNVNIVFHDDDAADRYLTGYASKFDGDIFSDDTTAQITLRCPNPYLINSTEDILVASGPTVPFAYDGSADTGFEIDLTLTTNTGYLTLDLNGKLMMLIFSFISGDKVHINTKRGERQIQLTRIVGGVTTVTDILYVKRFGAEYAWLEIHDEANIMKAYGLSESSTVANITRIAHRAYHWGI